MPFTREGMPSTREGMPFTREGMSFTREGMPFTREGMPFTREGFDGPGAMDPADSLPTDVSVEKEEVVVSTVPDSSGKVIVCEVLGSSKCSVRALPSELASKTRSDCRMCPLMMISSSRPATQKVEW